MTIEPRYYVNTYDPALQTVTPQAGVPEGPYTLWELRAVLRELRQFGYSGDRRDPGIYIWREDD
jgi:hypothetical protein